MQNQYAKILYVRSSLDVLKNYVSDTDAKAAELMLIIDRIYFIWHHILWDISFGGQFWTVALMIFKTRII